MLPSSFLPPPLDVNLHRKPFFARSLTYATPNTTTTTAHTCYSFNSYIYDDGENSLSLSLLQIESSKIFIFFAHIIFTSLETCFLIQERKREGAQKLNMCFQHQQHRRRASSPATNKELFFSFSLSLTHKLFYLSFSLFSFSNCNICFTDTRTLVRSVVRVRLLQLPMQ
jgi:hypothetical protein